jgi:rubredoxin
MSAPTEVEKNSSINVFREPSDAFGPSLVSIRIGGLMQSFCCCGAVLLLLLNVVSPAACWVGPGARPALFAARRGLIRAAEQESSGEEGVTFTFGDAAESSFDAELEQEERELTDKEKEILRLKAAEKFIKQDTGNAVCRTCSYMYRMDEGAPGVPKRTPFELIPDAWACPNCKSPKAFFDPEQIEIAGFADNQAYGFGTNTWTEAQKSNAIFGGIAFFFALLLSGYALN